MVVVLLIAEKKKYLCENLTNVLQKCKKMKDNDDKLFLIIT